MLDGSVLLVGKRLRESGGVRYAGFRVLRGGEEPRRHGVLGPIVAEKQPTAAPAHTVPPLRRSLAALGPSSLRRSSVLTVLRMAMRSDILDTALKFHPARYTTVAGNLEEHVSLPIFEPRQGNEAGERNFAHTFAIVEKRRRASNVHSKSISNVQESPLTWCAGSKFVLSGKCKGGCEGGEIVCSWSDSKFPPGVVDSTGNSSDRKVERLVVKQRKDTVRRVFVEVLSIRIVTIAHAPRTCYASHAGGPTRTYGPPIAPQLDDRVSVTLDFRASAGLGLPGTIPTLRFIRFRRSPASRSPCDRTCQTDPPINRSKCSSIGHRSAIDAARSIKVVEIS